MKTAVDPTDIIWENRHISKRNRACRGTCVLVPMLVIMYFFFASGTVAVYGMITMRYWAHPPGVNCDEVVRNYGDYLPEMAY